MPKDSVSDHQLLAYLDEMLPVEEMATLEKEMRGSQSLRRRAASLTRRRDQGLHSVGEIWRRLRLSCPTRSQLGSYLLEALDTDFSEYVDFHIRAVGCRLCAANLADLEQSLDSSPETPQRRRKFFQSSAGFLKKLGEY